MKKKLKVIGIILGVVIIIFVAGFITMMNKSKAALAKQVNVDIDMNKVADGIYFGESDGGMMHVKLNVEVKDHKIVNIDLIEHKCGKGKKAEVIIDDMVKKNTDDVDAVSGATGSSKTIRNAVNIALQQGLQK